MTDREKVMKGLECCLANGHNNCPYKSTDEGIDKVITCTTYLMQDALALLKAQEPRVMTLEEVVEHYSLPLVVLDDIGWQEDYLQDIEPLYFDFLIDYSWAVHWRGYQQAREYIDDWKASYGQKWRCWTSRPTDEQRKEARWNA